MVKKDQWRICRIVVLSLLFAVYTIYLLWAFLHTEAWVPDERWFFYLARTLGGGGGINLREYTHLENRLGYGAVYWYILNFSKTVLTARIYSLTCQISIPVLLVITLKMFRTEQNMDNRIAVALLLYFSSPFAWFTGKIIGPELIGNCLGAMAATILLWMTEVRNLCTIGPNIKTRIILISGSLLGGVATGVKPNYIVFLVFWGVYFTIKYITEENRPPKAIPSYLKILMLVAIGFIIGFIAANPVSVTDPKIYISNIAGTNSSNFSVLHLKNCLFKECIEWDFVNSGGMNETIISAVAAISVFVIGCIWGNKRVKILCIASLLACCFLLLLCCRGDRFLGWYLLPFLYLIPISVHDKRIMYPILALNFFILLPGLCYQIQAKNDQIAFIKEWDEYTELMQEYQKEFPEAEPVYYVEMSPESVPDQYLNRIYQYEKSLDKPQLIFISKRALANGSISYLFNLAASNREGYTLIDSYKSLHVCIFQPEKRGEL